jgi:hypothetical protein
MLTVKQLRDLLEGLKDEAPIRVALVRAEDGQKLLDAAEALPNDESLNVRMPSALPAVQAVESDDGGVLVLAFSHEE